MSRLREAMDAVRANPKNAGAWVTLGEQLVAEGQLEKGTQSFQRALQLDPTNASAQRGLAQILLAGGFPPPGGGGATMVPPSAPTPRPTAQSIPALPPKSAPREAPSSRVNPEPISAPRPAITREDTGSRRSMSRANGGVAMEMRNPPLQAIKPSRERMMMGIIFLIAVPLLCICALIFAVAQMI